MEFAAFDERQPEFFWLSHAPILRARPGTLEHFSDIPLLMYVEQDVSRREREPLLAAVHRHLHERGRRHADRPPDGDVGPHDRHRIRLRSDDPDGHEEIQAEGHKWTAFEGPREGTHPILWVSTTNNMVADHGPDDVVRFAPAPQLVSLAGTSRERVMDDNPWTYAVTSAEMLREHRIDPARKARDLERSSIPAAT